MAPPARAARIRREVAESLFRRPLLAFAPKPWDSNGATPPPTPGLARALPPNVALLSLERLEPETVLLRLMHKYAQGEDGERSQNVTVPLAGLFNTFDVTSATELSLFANSELASVHRLAWKTDKDGAEARPGGSPLPPPVAPHFDVLLTPLKVRTFRLSVRARAATPA